MAAVTEERGGHYGTKAADTSRARPAPRPGCVVGGPSTTLGVVGGPSTTLGNVVNGPSTTLLCSQRPIHHVGEFPAAHHGRLSVFIVTDLLIRWHDGTGPAGRSAGGGADGLATGRAANRRPCGS
jgi:hypothetical protein